VTISGVDDKKTQEQRDLYDRMLGQDPCYHKACDAIQNINQFAFEKMIQRIFRSSG